MRNAVVPVFVLLLAASCCLGEQAREDLLWPVVRDTWPAVKEDVELGAGTTPAANVVGAMNQIDGAVRADDRKLLAGVAWFLLEPLASAGVRERINRGMSEGVAASLTERNKQFAAALQELTKR
jgi:hypothetical protein